MYIRKFNIVIVLVSNVCEISGTEITQIDKNSHSVLTTYFEDKFFCAPTFFCFFPLLGVHERVKEKLTFKSATINEI